MRSLPRISQRLPGVWLTSLLLTITLLPWLKPAQNVVRASPPTRLGNPSDLLFQKQHRQLDSLQIRGACLIVEVDVNRFFLYDATRTLLRTGPCSTGKDSVLEAPDGRRWQFSTPRGLRRVRHKASNPVWAKPDWAYLEEGLPIPPKNADERYIHGILGPFALDIEKGYLVHGSPYTIDIGQKVTHGCVRLLDEDLELVYRTLQIGDPVLLN